MKITFLFSFITFFSCQLNAQSVRLINDSILYEKAYKLYLNGDYNLAKELYDKVIVSNPNYVSAYQERGIIYLTTKKKKLAFIDFTFALSLDTLDPISYDCLGLYYINNRKMNKALYYFNKAILCDSSFILGYSHRGALYSDLREYKKAESDLLKTIDLSENISATDYYNLGRLYSYKLKEYIKAIELLTKCIELDSKYQEAFKCRAYAYLMLGEQLKYKQDKKKAKELKKTPIIYD